MPVLQPYRGTVRKLVLGIDVGAAHSEIAYSILYPGEIPQIRSITRFPGQESAAGGSKIPSILYYRPDGTVHSVGAEAMKPGIELEVEDEDLIFVEWFKLHLRPERLDSEDIQRHELPPLPLNKSVVDVFADFLAYLFSCARKYICETHASGETLWNSVDGHIEFVLSHPNGWEGLQQSKMREAAVKAKLIPNTTAGQACIRFVTEGEARLNSIYIQGSLTTKTVHDGQNMVIVDAGRETVDVSSYSFRSVSPMSFEEITSADCLLQGSTRVNARAEKFLRERLATSSFGNDEDIKMMLEYFEKSTKLMFKDEKEQSYIKFGSLGCNDPTVNIRHGQLMLDGRDIASFFKPSLDAIVDVVQKQLNALAITRTLSVVFLVGDFVASPWLYSSLKERLNAIGATPAYRPDSHMNKTVAIGAVCYYIENFVSARVMKMTYGIECNIAYNAEDPEHHLRRDSRFTSPSGRIYLPNAFSAILKKGTRVRENKEISESFFQEALESSTLNSISAEVICFRGGSVPKWIDVDEELFMPLCTIYADTSQVTRLPRNGPNGLYYTQEFDVVLLCGLTELQAQIKWMDNGVEKRGPAKVVHDNYLAVLH